MTDRPEEGCYEGSAYKPEPKRLPDYEDCPCCPACGAHALVPGVSYARAKADCTTDRDLLCAVCGWIVVGTLEQVDQAKKAEEAWETRTDERKGPWTKVLKTRARREKGQLRLFGASRSTERTGGC